MGAWRRSGPAITSSKATATSGASCGSARIRVVLRGRGATIEFTLEPERNPIENPYVSGERTSHRASAPYVDRSRRRPGMAYERGTLVRALDAIGWRWGGRWTAVKDYQHFSASGR